MDELRSLYNTIKSDLLIRIASHSLDDTPVEAWPRIIERFHDAHTKVAEPDLQTCKKKQLTLEQAWAKASISS